MNEIKTKDASAGEVKISRADSPAARGVRGPPPAVDQEGIGGTPFLTFGVDTDDDQDFSQSDLNDNLTACVVTGNYVVGMGVAGYKLFGKVVWVSQSLQAGTTVPALCAVQARGVARFRYVFRTRFSGPPEVNEMVEVAGAGRVRPVATDVDLLPGGHLAKGQVIAVDTVAQTCDVWLG